MAKDDDLLPEDQPAENTLPEEKGGMTAEPAAAPAVAAAPVEPPSPIAAELSAKPRSNVWTLLMLIIMVSMLAGMYVQLRELNEVYKVNVPIIGQKEGDTNVPAKETMTEPTEDTGTSTSATEEKPKEEKPAETPAPK